MSNTTLPRLTWKQFLAVRDEKREQGQDPQSWTTAEVASNHKALDIQQFIYFMDWDYIVECNPWSDPAVRDELIELLTEDGYAAAYPDRIQQIINA